MDLIHAAAEWGLQPMVARLAQEEPALVNAANEFGWTCLMLACSRGHVGLAAWLLDHGARLEQGDADGLTALTHAACGRRGRREAVALLLARGADPNAAGRWGSTALMEAAGLGLVGRVRALLEGSPREGPRALRLDARDAKGSTALSRACMDGRVEAVRVLLAAGADPTVPNHEGLSPMLATLGGRHRGKGRAITALLERAMLEPCRVRYLRQARFAHEASGGSVVPVGEEAAAGAATAAAEEEGEEEVVVAAVVAPAVLAFQAQGRAQGRALPRVEVTVPVEAAAAAAAGGASSGSRKRPRPGPGQEDGGAAEAAAAAASAGASSSCSGPPLSSLATAAAVARHVSRGGLAPALFEELMGLLAVPWDPARRGEVVSAGAIEAQARGERAWVEANRGEVERLSERRQWRRQRRLGLEGGGGAGGGCGCGCSDGEGEEWDEAVTTESEVDDNDDEEEDGGDEMVVSDEDETDDGGLEGGE